MAVCVAGVNVNVMLGILNPVPIPPLDGSRVLAEILPDRVGQTTARVEPYGLIILALLLSSGVLNLIPIVSNVSDFILSCSSNSNPD